MSEETWLDRQLEEAPEAEAPEETVEQVEAPAEPEVPEIQAEAETPTEAPAEAPVEAPETKPTYQVPLNELMKERDKRQSLDAENRVLRDSFEELKRQIEEMRNPPEPVPDKDEDPAGYLEHQQAELQKQMEQMQQQTQQQQQQQQMEQQRAQVQNYIASAEEAFKKTHPDYQDALAHMRQAQYDQLITQGGLNEQQALQRIYQVEFQEGVNLLAMGYNPAEMIYRKAQQYGYQNAQGKPQEDLAAKEKIENLDAALNAAKGGGNKGGKVDLKDMLEADEGEFNAIWDDVFKGAKKY